MRILALEPYYGGSHRAFVDNWSSISRHDWTVLGLPAHKWKWRMRHGAVTLADRVNELASAGHHWDILFCSDMLNLAEFRGLVADSVSALPAVAYFHENQLTYPVRREEERDLHFAMINFTTALAAREVWFNSAFHRDSFLEALSNFLRRMPDHPMTDKVDQIRGMSSVRPQGINPPPPRASREASPAHILWVARWEHDKNPELFFTALRKLVEREVAFRVSVVGQSFDEVPEIFATAPLWLGDRIAQWGFQPTRDDYEKILSEADIVVSTADHEFFGVGIVEAVAAGAFPLLPKRLAYPEIFPQECVTGGPGVFYDGSLDSLVSSLTKLIEKVGEGSLWGGDSQRLSRKMKPYFWPNLAPVLDLALDEAALR